MRLNGWQRIGIVASVIWAIGAPFYLDQAAQQEASAVFSRNYNLCRDNPSNSSDRCYDQAKRLEKDIVPRYRLLPPDTANVASVSLVPIVLGWLLAYALVYLVRWIWAGFAKQ